MDCLRTRFAYRIRAHVPGRNIGYTHAGGAVVGVDRVRHLRKSAKVVRHAARDPVGVVRLHCRISFHQEPLRFRRHWIIREVNARKRTVAQ